jgi:hypothetical protein
MPRFSRIEVNTREPSESSTGRARQLGETQVEFYNFIPGSRARVFHIHFNCERSPAFRSLLDNFGPRYANVE